MSIEFKPVDEIVALLNQDKAHYVFIKHAGANEKPLDKPAYLLIKPIDGVACDETTGEGYAVCQMTDSDFVLIEPHLVKASEASFNAPEGEIVL